MVGEREGTLRGRSRRRHHRGCRTAGAAATDLVRRALGHEITPALPSRCSALFRVPSPVFVSPRCVSDEPDSHR